MTVNFPPLSPDVLPALASASLAAVLLLYLRKELAPDKVVGIWQTEGVLSARQIWACVLGIYALCMYAAGRMGDTAFEQTQLIVLGIFGVGQLPKLTAAVWPAPTEIKVKTAQVKADGDVNLQTTLTE